MTQSFYTIRDLLRYAVSRFNQAQLSFGHGSTNAYDEAVYLILHTLHLPIDRLDPFLDARLLDSEHAMVLDMIEKRAAQRLPAAYLTGEAWLQGYRFSIDSRVIVPRSLLAELLVEQLHPWIDDPEAVQTVLELCTGSGCLAVIAADAFENSKIDAVDLSPEALAVARRNIEAYGLDKRITLYEGDLYAPLSKSTRAKQHRYDLIIANPPYVNEASMRTLPPEYRHEPELALAGGLDGMDLVRRIIANARQWLQPDGILVIEIGNERWHAEAMFEAFAHACGSQITPTWLMTSAGDDAVFLLHAADLPVSI